MDAPRLLIIAEHDVCSSTQAWLSTLIEIAANLLFFPHAMLQIRAKTKPQLREQACRILSTSTQISVNCSTDDVHLFSGFFPHHPQKKAPKNALSYRFGMSIHEAHDATYFDQYSPLYYQLGPIFTPLSKEGNAQGIELLSNTRQKTHTPLISVGGIVPDHIPALLLAGSHGIASSGYIMQSTKPLHALEELYSTIMMHVSNKS